MAVDEGRDGAPNGAECAPHDGRDLRLLLDSHSVYWALYEPEKLSGTATDLLRDEHNDLFVSLASLWELASKAAVYRLPLAGTSSARIAERIDELGVTWLAIRREDILTAASLPPHHLDPFDRMLIAQAQAHSLTLMTKDPKIALYDVKTLWS